MPAPGAGFTPAHSPNKKTARLYFMNGQVLKALCIWKAGRKFNIFQPLSLKMIGVNIGISIIQNNWYNII
jgi:hypothetical protein